MYRLHLSQNLRTLGMLLASAGVIMAMVLLWWANHTGLPDSWRAAIETEVGKHGAHVRIGSLSYIPFKGLITTDVHVYADAGRTREISWLERVILDFDKTKLARGKLQISEVELKDARLSLPIDPEKPDSETLEMTDVNGSVRMPGGRLLEIRNASGKVAGFDVNLRARILGYHHDPGDKKEDPNAGKRRALLAKVLAELKNWDFGSKKAPTLKIAVEGDVNDRSSIIATLQVSTEKFGRGGHLVDNVSAEGTMAGDLLTITSLKARDRRGSFLGHVDYNIASREGRFDADSSLEVPRLLRAWLEMPMPAGIAVAGRQSLGVEGEFQLDEKNVPEVRLTGHARCDAVQLRNVKFDTVESSFSWRGGNLYLRDVKLRRKDGEASGKALIEGGLVRLALKSSLPAKVCQPFFPGQPLEVVLGDFGTVDGKPEKVAVELEGGFDTKDRASWAYSGSGRVENVTYKGVPVDSAECGFSLSHHELDFFKGTVVFNYDNYPLRKAFDGPRKGAASVGRIRYVGKTKLVEVEDIAGNFWAAPMVRFFAPKIADPIEEYRFHRPPALKASGVVDVTPQGRTNLNISFKSETPADYRFLGENLTLGQPGGKVTLRGDRLNVDDLSVSVFNGPVAAKFSHSKGQLDGELSWTRLDMPELSSAYGFEMKDGGLATGRIEFSMKNGKVETMDGSGLVALEKAELFSVPMFGPLTPLVAGVLGDSRGGSQRAKNAFFSYQIKDGILSSSDFRTATSSLVFTGDGTINLIDRTVDMTIRMNARGLLGLITLPLRPFYGLFQFRGTGPLKDPVWEKVGFTAPPPLQNEALLSPPRALVVEEE